MRGNQARVKRAVELVLEHLDYIIDHHTAPNFVEVTGRMGGDVITYRIYNDGSMYERYDGARIENIAAYIGDLVSTTEKYYVAIRKKVKLGQQTKHIVELPKKQMSDNKVG